MGSDDPDNSTAARATTIARRRRRVPGDPEIESGIGAANWATLRVRRLCIVEEEREVGRMQDRDRRGAGVKSREGWAATFLEKQKF